MALSLVKFVDSLRRFNEATQEWLKRDKLLLLQDNTPAQTCKLATEFFNKVHQELWPHPAYSPDLSPCDFWPFPFMKERITISKAST